jgi:hypothetical protein
MKEARVALDALVCPRRGDRLSPRREVLRAGPSLSAQGRAADGGARGDHGGTGLRVRDRRTVPHVFPPLPRGVGLHPVRPAEVPDPVLLLRSCPHGSLRVLRPWTRANPIGSTASRLRLPSCPQPSWKLSGGPAGGRERCRSLLETEKNRTDCLPSEGGWDEGAPDRGVISPLRDRPARLGQGPEPGARGDLLAPALGLVEKPALV